MIKRIVYSSIIALSLVAGLIMPVSLQAQSIADNVCRGVLSTESGQTSANTTVKACTQSGDQTLASVTQRIVNLFSILVGAVSVIMIIIGGFRYIISGGDSTSVTAAKNTILYAIVGLVVVLFSQVIVRFVITNVRL